MASEFPNHVMFGGQIVSVEERPGKSGRKVFFELKNPDEKAEKYDTRCFCYAYGKKADLVESYYAAGSDVLIQGLLAMNYEPSENKRVLSVIVKSVFDLGADMASEVRNAKA